MSVLGVDVGNTNISCALLFDKKTGHKFYFSESSFKPIARKITAVIIVSVSPVRLKRVVGVMRKYFKGKIIVVGKDIHVPISSVYNRKQIGQDRLVAAYAAGIYYGRPSLVIDLGTAVTFDVVSRSGSYRGGLIFPGIKMSLESLHAKTALLPEIVLKRPAGFIGRETTVSMNNGIVYGYSFLCEGMAERFRAIYKGLKVVITGGNAKLIAKYVSSVDVVDEDLIFKGLRAILSDKIKC